MPLPHRKLLTSDLTKHSAFRFNKLRSFLSGTQKDDLIKAGNNDGNTLIRGKGGVDLLHGNAGNDLIFGGGGDDSIYAGDGDDIVFGGHGDDLIHGDGGNDVLSGGGGMDNIFGGDGDDVLVGGHSFDLLMGNAGNDTFVFRRGDGNDTILTETEPDLRRDSGCDTVYFSNLRADQLHSIRMEKEPAGGVNMVIDYGQGDRITIRNQQHLGIEAIDTFRFADNRKLSAEGLLRMYSGAGGTLAADYLPPRRPSPAQMQFHLAGRGRTVGVELPRPSTAIANTPLHGIVDGASHNASLDTFSWQESLSRRHQ